MLAAKARAAGDAHSTAPDRFRSRIGCAYEDEDKDDSTDEESTEKEPKR